MQLNKTKPSTPSMMHKNTTKYIIIKRSFIDTYSTCFGEIKTVIALNPLEQDDCVWLSVFLCVCVCVCVCVCSCIAHRDNHGFNLAKRARVDLRGLPYNKSPRRAAVVAMFPSVSSHHSST